MEAMHGLLDSGGYCYDETSELAKESYAIANAMLDEREKFR
jgi:hypothetical protein